MTELFSTLNRAVEGSPLAALGAALVWGILSVILSPCHLASIPLIVGFVGGRREITIRRSFFISLLFALGVLASIGVIGAITASLGRLMGDAGGWANWLAAAVFMVFGLHLLDVLPLPVSGPASIAIERKGYLAALVVGFVYGIALGPCTFAYMAPVLAVGFRIGASSPLFASVLFLSFGLGHCAAIAGAGTSATAVQRWLRWGGESKGMAVLRKVCGILVIAGGLYFIWTAR